ncbi:hypothetical protein HAX54_035394, partial [Datura stramonium]|nr:hypothetical protein [Datura stramonium]
PATASMYRRFTDSSASYFLVAHFTILLNVKDRRWVAVHTFFPRRVLVSAGIESAFHGLPPVIH